MLATDTDEILVPLTALEPYRDTDDDGREVVRYSPVPNALVPLPVILEAAARWAGEMVSSAHAHR